MKSISFGCTIIMVLVFFGSLAANAAIPQAINVQGVFKDANGKAIANTTYSSASFALWDGVPAGINNLMFGKTVSITTDQNGFFSAVIDLSNSSQWHTASGYSISNAFTRPVYMTVNTDSSTTLSPAQPLLSAPYALAAGSLQGVTIKQTASGGNLVGIDNPSPAAALHVRATWEATDKSIGAVIGNLTDLTNGSLGDFLNISPKKDSLGNSLQTFGVAGYAQDTNLPNTSYGVYGCGGTVGVYGGAIPLVQELFKSATGVAGNGTIYGVLGTGTTAGVYGTSSAPMGNGGLFVAQQIAGNGIYVSAPLGYGITVNGGLQGINSLAKNNYFLGNVGIGTSEPSNKLEVISDSDFGIFNQANKRAIKGQLSDVSAVGILALNNSGVHAGLYGYDSSVGGYGVYSHVGKNYFGGKVGIGTTNPSSPLEIENKTQAYATLISDNANYGSVLQLRSNYTSTAQAETWYLGAINFLDSGGNAKGQINYYQSKLMNTWSDEGMTFNVNSTDMLKITKVFGIEVLKESITVSFVPSSGQGYTYGTATITSKNTPLIYLTLQPMGGGPSFKRTMNIKNTLVKPESMIIIVGDATLTDQQDGQFQITNYNDTNNAAVKCLIINGF